MLISECSDSTNRRFDSRGKARFFFQPLQFHLEPTDVLVKLFNQRFLALGFASTVGKDLLKALRSLLFLLRDLGRVNPHLTDDFVDRLVPLESF